MLWKLSDNFDTSISIYNINHYIENIDRYPNVSMHTNISPLADAAANWQARSTCRDCRATCAAVALCSRAEY